MTRNNNTKEFNLSQSAREAAMVSIKSLAGSELFKKVTRQHATTILLGAFVMVGSTLAGIFAIEYQADFLALMKPTGSLSPLIKLFVLFTFFQVLFELLQFAKRSLQNKLAIEMAQSIKLKIFAKLMRFNTAELSAVNQGNVNQLFTADASQLASVWAEGILAFVTSLTLALGVSAVLFLKIGWPGFIFLLSLLVLVHQAARFSGESAPILRARAFFSSERLAQIQESIRSVGVVKMLTLENHFFAKVTDASKKEAEQRLLATRVASRYVPFFASLRWLAWALVLLWIVYAPDEKATHTAEEHVSLIFAVNWYSTLLQDAFLMIGAYLNFIQIGAVSASRLDAFFSSAATEEDADSNTVSMSVPAIETGDRIVRFSDATFSYPARPQFQVLHLPRFEIRRGSFVGIVGRIGAGKSTLIRALAGEIEPTHGFLWRSPMLRTALVTQEPFLISSTLRDTIRFQFENSTQEDEKLQRMIADSQFSRDFAVLSDGWDTLVGERGLTLSGGQKMRMSLARAAYFESANMILLDDPLSSLDQATAVKVTESLILGRWAGKTRVLVTHFIDALKDADLILVLDRGVVVDEGRYEELLQRCSLFSEIKRQSHAGP